MIPGKFRTLKDIWKAIRLGLKGAKRTELTGYRRFCEIATIYVVILNLVSLALVLLLWLSTAPRFLYEALAPFLPLLSFELFFIFPFLLMILFSWAGVLFRLLARSTFARAGAYVGGTWGVMVGFIVMFEAFCAPGYSLSKPPPCDVFVPYFVAHSSSWWFPIVFFPVFLRGPLLGFVTSEELLIITVFSFPLISLVIGAIAVGIVGRSISKLTGKGTESVLVLDEPFDEVPEEGTVLSAPLELATPPIVPFPIRYSPQPRGELSTTIQLSASAVVNAPRKQVWEVLNQVVYVPTCGELLDSVEVLGKLANALTWEGTVRAGRKEFPVEGTTTLYPPTRMEVACHRGALQGFRGVLSLVDVPEGTRLTETAEFDPSSLPVEYTPVGDAIRTMGSEVLIRDLEHFDQLVRAI